MFPTDSLDTYLDFLTTHNIDDDALYDHMCQVNTHRLGVLLSRLKRVEAMTAPRGKAGARFNSKRNNLKGRLYESVVKVLVDGVSCFQSYTRVITSTNEIDILVQLGPSALFVPSLRLWGTHYICECKFHSTYVKNDWISKLNTVLETHSSSVGVLFSRKGVADRGNGAKVRTALQFLANKATPVFIITFDWSDLEACVAGENFLKIISERFISIRTGSKRLDLLAS